MTSTPPLTTRKYTFEQFAKIRIYTQAFAYSPDGTQIAFVCDESGQFNLWLVPSGEGTAAFEKRRQLTHYADNTVRDIKWSPDGKHILFLADQNGDEMNQVYLLDVASGEIKALTQNLSVQYYIGGFSPDGKQFVYFGNDDVPTNQDAILYDMETGERTRITRDMLVFGGEWSPDGRYLTLLKAMSNTNLDILVYDRETGTLENATAHDGEVVYAPGPWSPDSKGFYFVTNEGKEFTGMAYYRMANGSVPGGAAGGADSTARAWDWVETPEHDIENIIVAKHAPLLVWSVNINGRSVLDGRNLKTGEKLVLPQLPLGVIGGMDFAPDGTKIALVFVRPGSASNLYEFHLQTGAFDALGESMLGGIDPADFIEPEFVTYETFDGRKIPAWLYKPKVGNAPYPVVLSIHGGPEAQERPTYNYGGLYQYLLNRGFGILAPNIRGSTGFGKSYQKLIHRDWGGAELKDIEYAAKYLQSLDWVDSNRLAVYGGSFGGFATLSALTRLPQYWACGVDLVGPSNLITFAKAVPPTWKRFMKDWVGDPDEDRDFLIERSPITYVDQIRAPLLVIQGANDPRVVKAESDQMVERIRANGGDVQYYVDDAEGHGTTRRDNRLTWYTMISQYLEDQLLDEPVLD